MTYLLSETSSNWIKLEAILHLKRFRVFSIISLSDWLVCLCSYCRGAGVFLWWAQSRAFSIAVHAAGPKDMGSSPGPNPQTQQHHPQSDLQGAEWIRTTGGKTAIWLYYMGCFRSILDSDCSIGTLSRPLLRVADCLRGLFDQATMCSHINPKKQVRSF